MGSYNFKRDRDQQAFSGAVMIGIAAAKEAAAPHGGISRDVLYAVALALIEPPLGIVYFSGTEYQHGVPNETIRRRFTMGFDYGWDLTLKQPDDAPAGE